MTKIFGFIFSIRDEVSSTYDDVVMYFIQLVHTLRKSTPHKDHRYCRFLFSSFFAIPLQRIPNKLKGQLIDTLRLTVKAGHGGNGLPKYGGVGGQGGCVYCVAKDDLTLTNVMKK